MTRVLMTWRFSLPFLAAALISPSSWAVSKNKPFQEYTYSKGLDSYHNPQSLPQGFVQDANNVLFDDKTPVDKRSGFTVAWSTKSYSYTGLWTYTDATNTTWQLARSSDQITANNLAGNTVLVATVSANNLIGEANAFGNAYFVDQTQGVYYWNGTSTTFVNPSPKGSIITQFHGRLWVTGAAVPNGNQLYGSGYFAGNTWTTGLNPTDPVQYSIGLQDNFDNTTAEYVYLDTLYLFKHYSIFALYGFDQTSFQISQLTQECGCIDGGSIQTYNSGLKFMSLRGVENFNGYSCTRISDPIKNKVDPAIQVGGFSQQSWLQSSQVDWNAGTFTPSGNLNSSIASPALALSTFSVVENSSTQWVNGTSSNVTVGVSSISFAFNNLGNITNPDFESSFSGNWIGAANFQRVSTKAGNSCGTVSPESGSFFASDQQGVASLTSSALEVLDMNSNVIASSSVAIDNDCTWHQATISPGINLGKRIKVRLHVIGAFDNIITTSDSYIWGGAMTFWYNSGTDNATFWNAYFDNIQNGSSTITSGSFTSQVFNTGITSPTYSLSGFNYSANTSTPPFNLQTSVNAAGPWTSILTSSQTNASGSQYAQYTTTLSVTSSDSAQTFISSITLIATASTGTLTSQIHNIGLINSWGNFSVSDILNAGNIMFSICSSTNSNMGVPESCASQISNSQINIATGTYVQWYATFTVTAATQTPTLNSVAVQWFSGILAHPMSSTIWDNRYLLSLTTNTFDTGNDAIVVLNKDNAWTSFDIHAGAFTQTKGSLYHADSQATGNIYLDNQGFSDNGSPINAYIRTRTFGLGDFAVDDFLYDVYPSALNTGNCAMSVSYRMDASTNSYSLGSPLLSEYSTLSAVRLPFPIDSSHQDFGQAIDFKFGTNDGSCDWQFFGFEGLFLSRPVQ